MELTLVLMICFLLFLTGINGLIFMATYNKWLAMEYDKQANRDSVVLAYSKNWRQRNKLDAQQ